MLAYPRPSQTSFQPPITRGLGLFKSAIGLGTKLVLSAHIAVFIVFLTVLFTPALFASTASLEDCRKVEGRGPLISCLETLAGLLDLETVVISPSLLTYHGLDRSCSRYASAELLGAVIIRSSGNVAKQRSQRAPAIRHFDAVTEKDFKAQMAHKRYHHICDRKSPKGLSSCNKAKWHYHQAISCLRAREAWEKRWGTWETAEPHERALENVRARLKNAERNRRRSCDTDFSDIH